MSWEIVKLGDISSNIQTGPFGSQLHQSDYSEEGTPVVMPKDLVDGHISEASIARVSVEHVVPMDGGFSYRNLLSSTTGEKRTSYHWLMM